MTRALAILTLLAATGAEPPRPGRLEDVRRGMSPDEVKRVLGPPDRVTREILYRRHIEQWHYADPPGRVDFNHVRGELPIVQDVTAEKR